MSKELKLNTLKFSLIEGMFAMNVDSTADYATNATEYFRKAMIGENSSRAMFRQVLGVKDRIKLGTAEFVSVVKAGDCEFNPSDSTIKQETFTVCPIMIGTSVCIDSLENSFVSDQISKGSANFTEPAFMSYFYETLSKNVAQELEYLTWRGNTTGGTTGATAYLTVCDGLEKTLKNSSLTKKPASAGTVTSVNVIAKMKEARDAVGTAVRAQADFAYFVSQNVYDALMDSIDDNKKSGLYYVEEVVLKFQGTEVVLAAGMSDNVIVAGAKSNFLNLSDLAADVNGFNVVDFMRTTLARKIGVRTDAKIGWDVVVKEEVFIHKP